MITHDIDEALRLADEILVLGQRPMEVLDRFSLSGPKLRRLDDPELMDIKKYVLSILKTQMARTVQ
jgi:NitT/TauT family transport system ATP-binding protein